MRLASLIQQFEGDYYRQYGRTCLPSHYKALSRLKDCRSEYSPKMKLECDDCHKTDYLPHSCGHRSCPHCQHHESQQWIENQLKQQVKGNDVLITFTVPAQLRTLFYTHQRSLYSLMFDVIWETLHTFSQNDKQLQGTPGAIAVLHTHNRQLGYHPHIHVIMPMAAINKKQRLWREKSGHFLFSHNALATVYRAKLLAGITQLGLTFLPTIPKNGWLTVKPLDKAIKPLFI